MSTRCQTKVIGGKIDSDDYDNITMYHHCDGYPENMIPLFYKTYLFGVTPRIMDWDKDNPKAEPRDCMAWQTFRAGYAASYLCYVDPSGFQPESSHELHGDIEWYYKLYVIGKKTKGQEKEQWEVEIYKAYYDKDFNVKLEKVLTRTPLCNLVDSKGEIKKKVLASIREAAYGAEDTSVA